MSYSDYEKVSDTLMYLGQRFAVKFNVALSTRDKYGNRKFFYKEYRYGNKNNENVVSIKRNILCNLSIEEVGNFQNVVFVTRSDMPILRGNTTTAAKWLQNNEVFGINKGGKLAILQDVSVQTQLNNSTAIRFEPVIFPLQNGEFCRGIRIYINDLKNFVDADERNFMEFYELIRSLDMYTAACAVIAAIPLTPEDAEVNRIDFENSAQEQRESYIKKPSFFDKK